MDVFRPEINAGVAAADDDGKQIKNTEANHYSKQWLWIIHQRRRSNDDNAGERWG